MDVKCVECVFNTAYCYCTSIKSQNHIDWSKKMRCNRHFKANYFVFDKKERSQGKKKKKRKRKEYSSSSWTFPFFSLKCVSECRKEYEIWNEMWNDAQFIHKLQT